MSSSKKVWRFDEMLLKVRRDTDLMEDDPDEQFVTKAEMIGYFNEAIDEAEAEIMLLNKDYFLTSDYVPLVTGEDTYDMPDNIFANKIRRVMYSNGSIIYPVKRIRDLNKFEQIEFAEQYSTADDYRYYLKNDNPGEVKMIIVPVSRETAIVPPFSSPSTPMIRWYIRNANRVPYEGEYTNPENVLSTAVDATANTIAVDPLVTYVTGDAVQLYVKSGATLPGGLSENTTYYVIAISSTSIKLATSLSNARAGTAIDITSAGTEYFTIKVAATDAIIDATLIDIPEFSTFIMEWVKANCLYKDGDPRIAGTVAKLEQQRKMLQETLADAEPDDDNQIQCDFSSYNEMS